MRLYVESGGRKEPMFFTIFNDKEFNRYISGFDEEKRRYGNLLTFDGSPQNFQNQDVFPRVLAQEKVNSLSARASCQKGLVVSSLLLELLKNRPELFSKLPRHIS